MIEERESSQVSITGTRLYLQDHLRTAMLVHGLRVAITDTEVRYYERDTGTLIMVRTWCY